MVKLNQYRLCSPVSPVRVCVDAKGNQWESPYISPPKLGELLPQLLFKRGFQSNICEDP